MRVIMGMFLYISVVICCLWGYGVAGFTHQTELYEGSPCMTENITSGICKKLPECPLRLAEVLAGKRNSNSGGRCGFVNYIEIVCCPSDESDKITSRAAEVACQEYTNDVASDTMELTWNILGGTRAASGEFPFMAALAFENTDGEIDDPFVYACGGSLISSNFILTAAHCVRNINNKVPKKVRLGSENLKSTGPDVQEIEIERILPHPQYRKSLNYHDIALLKLAKPARLSNNIRPVCLQSRSIQNSNIDSNTSFVVIGFGATTEFDITSENLIKSADLNLVSRSICSESYTREVTNKLPQGLDDKMICAVDANATRRSDACHGDSGGPLLMISEDIQMVLGVTSFGQSCGTEFPAVYTSVYAYLPWIESVVWPERTGN